MLRPHLLKNCLGILIGLTFLQDPALEAKSPNHPTAPPQTDGRTMEQRVKAIAQYFSPEPGNSVTLDADELRDIDTKRSLSLRGFIHVTPPKGICLTLRTKPELPDQQLCKKGPVAFKASDLQDDGSVHWQILGPGDIDPIDVSWPTPHRIGKRVPAMKKLASLNEPFLVINCRPERDPRGPLIRLTNGDGENWTILFPEKDKLTSQAPELPNVYVQGMESIAGPANPEESGAEHNSEGKDKPKEHAAKEPTEKEGAKEKKSEHGESAEAKKPSKEDEKSASEQGNGGEGAPKEEGHGGKEEKKKKPKPPPSKRYQIYEDKEHWTIPRRDAFTMSAEGFKTLNDQGPTNGSCRYQLSGAFHDPKSGWIECHNTGMYDIIFLHLSCAKQFEEIRRDHSNSTSSGERK